MWKSFWTIAAIVAVVGGFMAWTSAQATFLYRHPLAKDVRIEIDHETGAAIVMRAVGQASPTTEAEAPIGAQPKAVAENPDYDFGIMDPLSKGRHDFVIRNEGTAPLRLRVGPTTCKCTVSGLDKSDIAVGEQAVVTLEWSTGTAVLYSHSATIYTNDPLQKSLAIRIRGKVRMQIGADAAELVLGDVPPDQPAVAQCLIYSQAWESFVVESVAAQLPGLQWHVQPVDPADAARLAPTSVQRLRVTIPAESLAGRFADTLRLKIKPAGEDKTHDLDLALQGNVQRRVAIFGSDIDELGVVDLGTLRQGTGKKVKLLVKIRDREPDLGQPRIEATPHLLAVQFAPHTTETGKGLYDLTIELPADTAPCQFLGTPQGQIVIRTEHPRVSQIELKVRFAVVQRSGL